MSDLAHTLTSLQSKIEKLVHLHKKGREDMARVQEEKEELNRVIKDKNAQIAELEERIKVLKLAKTLTNDNTTDIKYRINELVREIDKSIALLNR